MKVCFETFGCRLSRAEALEEEASYLAQGWSLTDSHADADLIVVRGCSVTARAQRDCEKLVSHLRAKYPLKRLLITGCLPAASKKNASPIPGAAPLGERALPARTARAYLKVQDGCSFSCSFCIVPTFRGKTSRSVPLADCLSRARAFIDSGYHEIVVTGCNLALYASEGKKLPDLIAALADLSPACRIRLGSVEPTALLADLLRVMASRPNICRHLHIPVQSGSTRILAAMRRPYTVRDIDSLVHLASSLLPDLALGCDLIAGFPGEGDTDHLASLALLSRLPFTHAHVFPYSERPGPAAAGFPAPIPPAVRSARAHALAAVVDDSRTRFAQSFKGKTVELVVEDPRRVAGWTSHYLWCDAGDARKDISRKDLVKVHVREVVGHRLFGDPL